MKYKIVINRQEIHFSFQFSGSFSFETHNKLINIIIFLIINGKGVAQNYFQIPKLVLELRSDLKPFPKLPKLA